MSPDYFVQYLGQAQQQTAFGALFAALVLSI